MGYKSIFTYCSKQRTRRARGTIGKVACLPPKPDLADFALSTHFNAHSCGTKMVAGDKLLLCAVPGVLCSLLLGDRVAVVVPPLIKEWSLGFTSSCKERSNHIITGARFGARQVARANQQRDSSIHLMAHPTHDTTHLTINPWRCNNHLKCRQHQKKRQQTKHVHCLSLAKIVSENPLFITCRA
jgi:hypothetical protein